MAAPRALPYSSFQKIRVETQTPLLKISFRGYSVFKLDFMTFPALFLGRADSKTISLGTN